MGKSKTEKMVKRIVQDSAKRSLYSEAELTYMTLQLQLMKLARQKKKLEKKKAKGF